MTINFKAPEIKELQPRLLVMGVGGAGGNAVNEMIENKCFYQPTRTDWTKKGECQCLLASDLICLI